jgi:hypothetical protein
MNDDATFLSVRVGGMPIRAPACLPVRTCAVLLAEACNTAHEPLATLVASHRLEIGLSGVTHGDRRH